MRNTWPLGASRESILSRRIPLTTMVAWSARAGPSYIALAQPPTKTKSPATEAIASSLPIPVRSEPPRADKRS